MTGKLRKRAQFLAVAGKGRKTALPGMVVQALARGDAEPARLGFTATKKLGNAVVRNRTKRRLRAAARILLARLPAPGSDLVLIGREATRSRRFAALLADLEKAMFQLRVG